MFVRFSTEEEQWLRRWIAAEGLSTFPPAVRADLTALLGSRSAVELIEARCAIGNFGDTEDHRDLRRAVLKLLRKDGVSLGRGKKPRPEMTALVESIVPIAMAFGVPLRVGETSKMVEVLRLIAANGLGMSGDPRRELRRQVTLKRTLEARTRRLILEAVQRGLQPLRSRRD